MAHGGLSVEQGKMAEVDSDSYLPGCLVLEDFVVLAVSVCRSFLSTASKSLCFAKSRKFFDTRAMFMSTCPSLGGLVAPLSLLRDDMA